MKIDKKNFKNFDLSNCLKYKIKLIGTSNRRGSNLLYKDQENCSGYNINKQIYDGMTVQEYQNMIKVRFHVGDPQFSLTKHLRYDIEKGFIELHS